MTLFPEGSDGRG
jgi:hypothetical protein